MLSLPVTQRAKEPPDYRADIDGLRAVAVMSVVAFHAFPEYVPGGFIGVDMFFVISGFLISGIIFSKLERGTFSFSEFYTRRIRRIFPALIIVLIACLAFGWLSLLPDEYRQLAKHTISGAGFTSNIQLWREAGYFDTASDHKPLLHLWSLGIEEQFYLIWPACLVLLWKRKGKVVETVAILGLLSFSLNALRVHQHPSSTFYLPFTRFWELLLGCVIAYGQLFPHELAGVFPRLRVSFAATAFRDVLAAAGAVLIVTGVLALNKDRDFPGWWALLPTLGTALLILAGPGAFVNRNVLQRPVMVFLGLISYPLYLWHWPVLSFARILTTPGPAARLTLSLMSILLAWLTWRYIELNLRGRVKRIGPTADIRALCLGLSFTCLLGLVVLKVNGVPARLPAASKSLLAEFNRPALSGYLNCQARPADLSICVQSKSGRPDAAVLGDSHAESIFPGIASDDPQRTWLAIGNHACPPALGIHVENTVQGCTEKMQHAFDYLTGQNGPGIVVMAFYGYYAENTNFSADDILHNTGPLHIRLDGAAEAAEKEEIFFRGLERSIQFLIAHQKKVFLVVDVPELPFLPRDCVPRPFFTKNTNCYVEKDLVNHRQQGMRRIVKRLQETFATLQIFDPTLMICDNSLCRPVRGDVSYYNDSHHLSFQGSEAIARSLISMINGV